MVHKEKSAGWKKYGIIIAFIKNQKKCMKAYGLFQISVIIEMMDKGLMCLI